MRRILVINPNRSEPCRAGIAEAVAPWRRPDLAIDVVRCDDGPPAIVSWADWHAAVAPLLREIAATPADAYVVACVSDPGLEAARAATSRPVLGAFRCAVAAAMTRAERFGVIALASASVARHALALRAMGAESRLAAEIPLDVPLETLLDPARTGALLAETARTLAARGAGAVVLGCTGMAGQRAAIEAACGVPVIEPCAAAAAMAALAVA